MNKIIIRSLTLGTLALGIGFTTQQVNASAAYRTVKTKSYASTTPAYHAKNATKSVYMWNSTLTKKLHNLKNYPKTTWYVQKSVKLTNGKKTGIFYYVKNKSNSASGYVWRSYLTKGKFAAKSGTSTTSTTTTTDSTVATSSNSLTFKYVNATSGATVASTSWIVPSNLLKSGASLSEGTSMKSILKDITSVLSAATADAPTGYDITDTTYPNVVTSKVGETLIFHVLPQN
ncbi:hypothetical protein [Secundilactobacillus folii]|uniref:D-alanyl-D-alanine carboxypeptidase n=1 Tax=Secundilactobacillus folii TaxID=2678357 RepID=A0A7X3C346_9LACO|nr:hypothetical protein [Secundilactobacillus folii]MTV82246.1 hypothetical protein [Secundilactobacillus folii]